MKNNTNNLSARYEAPEIMQFEIAVEQGFAASVEELGETLPEQVW